MDFEYYCPRCGYNTSRKALMVKHLHRTRPCIGVSDGSDAMVLLKQVTSCIAARKYGEFGVACTCGKVLKNRLSLNHHRAYHCALREPRSVGEASDAESVQDELRALRQQVERLSAQLPAGTVTIGKVDVTNVVNNVSGSVNTVNATVTINAFGRETTEHITPQFLDQCVKRTSKGLVELIEKIHFDPGHQQNCNLKITNVKMPIMQVHNGRTWKYDTKEKVLNQLVDRGHGIMQDHFDDHEDRIRDQVSQTMFDHIRGWMDRMADRDKKTLEAVLTDIYVLVLNAGSD